MTHCVWIVTSFLFFLYFSSPCQREAREGEEGEDQAAGADQGGGIRWRGGHGKREEDLSAANVWGEELVPIKIPEPDSIHIPEASVI